MMCDRQSFGWALALLWVACTDHAASADYEFDIVNIEIAPQLASIEEEGGWYVRGDMGYDLGTRERRSFYRTFDSASYTQHMLNGLDLSKSYPFGLGVGYTVTDVFRGDAVVSRFSSQFSGFSSCGSSLGADCRRDFTSVVTGYSVLANAYLDLGTFIGLSPYMGAGAGYAYLGWDDFQSHDVCHGARCFGSLSAVHPGESDWRLTYAMMAGVAYKVADNLKLDIGYRYTDIGGGDMYSWDEVSISAGAEGIQGYDSGFSTHEVRIGFRFAFGKIF